MNYSAKSNFRILRKYVFLIILCLVFISCASNDDQKAEISPTRIAYQKSFLGKAVGEDSMGGFNRAIHDFNDFLIMYMIRPVGWVYESVMPEWGIKRFYFMARNLGFPKRMFAAMLQGKFGEGGIVFARFLINTTVGIGGAFDASYLWYGSDYCQEHWRLTPGQEDFGQTFASWGMGRGGYLVLPFLGPGNIRYWFGSIFDTVLDGKNYIYGAPGAGAFLRLNQLLLLYPAYFRLVTQTNDPYQQLKILWAVYRVAKIKDWSFMEAAAKKYEHKKRFVKNIENYEKIPDYDSQGGDLNSIRILYCRPRNKTIWGFISPWNSDFRKQLKTESVEIFPGKPKFEYAFIPAYNPENEKKISNAPLVMLVPGFGGNYRDSSLRGLAQILYNNGYSVALISNPTSTEFMKSASSIIAPGYPPIDSADLRRVIKIVKNDLIDKHGINSHITKLAGYSLAGLQLAYIAKMEETDNTLDIDKYLLINPTLKPKFSLDVVDEYMRIARKINKDDDSQNLLFAFGTILRLIGGNAILSADDAIIDLVVEEALAKNKKKSESEETIENNSKEKATVLEYRRSEKEIKPDSKNKYRRAVKIPPIPDRLAKGIIGFAFYRELMEILLEINMKSSYLEDAGLKIGAAEKFRQKDYAELMDFTYLDYVDKILYRAVKEKYDKKIALEDLYEKGIINQEFEMFFKNSSKVSVIHSMDDFIVSPQQLLWLKNTFGDRAVIFEYGGHLGNLYTSQFNKAMLKLLSGSIQYEKNPKDKK